MLGQSTRWMLTPRPWVMYPVTGSPGRGLQHRPNRMSTLSTPRIRIPWAAPGGHSAQALGPQRGGAPGPAHLLLQHLPAPEDVLVAALLLEPLADLRPRVARLHEGQPVAARPRAALAGEDLDDVPRLEAVVERHEPAVHLGPGGVVAHVRVDPEGEVHGRGPGRQVDDVALGREDEDLVLEEVDLHRVHELPRVLHLLVPLQELPQPRELLGELALGPAPALLVAPVGGDAVLGGPVHLRGPDLDLERVPLADHRRVERLVAARLGVGDVVVHLAGNGLPQGVDDPEGLVALPDVVDDDAHPDPVVDPPHALALVL